MQYSDCSATGVRPVLPAELNWVTTYLCVRDANKALDFYTALFGFSLHQAVKNKEDKILFARITYQGSDIIFGPPDALGDSKDAPIHTLPTSPSSIRLFVYCNDVEQRYQKCLEHGCTILSPLEDRFWGDRSFRVSDLDGYSWGFATNPRDFDHSILPVELQ